MKKFFIAVVLMIQLTGTSAQNIKREGKVFQIENVSTNKATDYTFKDKDGKQHTICLSKNGRAYYLRTSKEGKEYKQYLPVDVSKQICKELGVTYVEKKQ